MITSFFKSADLHTKRFQRSAIGPHLPNASTQPHARAVSSPSALVLNPYTSNTPSSSSFMSMSTSTNGTHCSSLSSQAPTQTDDTTSPPRPGKSYIIRSRSNSKVITFIGGSIVLCPPGSLGTYRWTCVETADNWLGFQDPASGMYLGYDSHAWLQCMAKTHGEWEYLAPRERPSGGFALLVLVEGYVLPVGVRTRVKGGVMNRGGKEIMEEGVKIRGWNSNGISWDFVEV